MSRQKNKENCIRSKLGISFLFFKCQTLFFGGLIQIRFFLEGRIRIRVQSNRIHNPGPDYRIETSTMCIVISIMTTLCPRRSDPLYKVSYYIKWSLLLGQTVFWRTTFCLLSTCFTCPQRFHQQHKSIFWTDFSFINT